MKVLHIKSVNIISNNGEDSNSIDNLKQIYNLNHETIFLSLCSVSTFEITLKLLNKFNQRYTNVQIFEKKISCMISFLKVDFIFVEPDEFIETVIEKYINDFSPDIVFTNFMDLRVINILQNLNLKYVAFVSDNTFPSSESNLNNDQKEVISKIKHLSTQSDFSRKKLLRTWKKDSFLLFPAIDPEVYRVKKNSLEFITLINPVFVKGVDLFVKLAEKIPEYIFVGVGGWTEEDAYLFKQMCKNYKNLKYISETDDMKNVYSRTRILLVPSLWEEAFGRVCMEAMLSGIPVITSKNGGLPETLNLAEFNLDTQEPDEWIKLIKKLGNKEYYNEISDIMAELSDQYLTKQKNRFLEFEKFLSSLCKNEYTD